MGAERVGEENLIIVGPSEEGTGLQTKTTRKMVKCSLKQHAERLLAFSWPCCRLYIFLYLFNPSEMNQVV